MTRRRVVVIGGGLIGTSCAYYLTRDDWDVTIVDAAEPGKACSHANCGLIMLSHVLPLNAPGTIGKTLRDMLRPNSPFSVRPRFDPGLWVWLTKFALRCTQSHSQRGAAAKAALLESTGRLYEQLMQEEPLECEWEHAGCLMVFRDEAPMRAFAATDANLRREFGIGAEPLDAAALLEFEPALKPVVAGAWYYAEDRHLRPDRLVDSWLRVVADRGVKIRSHCRVTGFRGRGSAAAVETTQGPIEADAFVVAAGALSPLLNQHLGCKLPIQPGKGYSITTTRPQLCPQRPILLQEAKVAITPMQSGYRIGSTMEFAGYDTTLNPRRLQLLRQAAEHYLHEPAGEMVEEEWYGWRPMTYDDCPIIDRSPAWENVWMAAGHNMLGLTMAPVTGQLIAEMVGGREPHLDIRPYGVSRF